MKYIFIAISYIEMDKTLLEFTASDVFTPDAISKKMSMLLSQHSQYSPHSSNSQNKSLLEPAVGTGQLLKFIDLSQYDLVHLYDIKQEYLAKCPIGPTLTKHHLDFIKTDTDKKYTHIILNPPFIRIQDLSVDYRSFVKERWPLLAKGNIDLYYAFLMKCLECLAEDGVMVAITPNSYLYNKSAVSLRKHLIANRFVQEIIDYKSQKVFAGVATYCCITVFTKRHKDHFIYNQDRIDYSDVDDSFLSSKSAVPKKCLGDICNIKNGIATLRDAIYIHPAKLYDEPCWKPLTTRVGDIEWVIYPYENGVIIKEAEFKTLNPDTYTYLLSQRDELAKRDKGSKTYPEWYAYGRTQSLVIPESDRVIFVPTFCDPANIECRIQPPSLFLGCLCIDVVDDEYTVEDVVEIIGANRSHIERNSSKRGGGWINLSSTILKAIVVD